MREARRRPRRPSPRRSATRASRTSCCWAWAARRWRPRSSAARFGEQDGWPRLHVLDSTDAGAVRARRGRASTSSTTLFLVSTKSGGTIETLSLFKHFWSLRPGRQRVRRDHRPGLGPRGRSPSEHGFRRTFLNDPDIGGRYSALSYFGLVPAALMGADVARPARRAPASPSRTARASTSGDVNSGLWLGLALGRARARRPRQADLRHRPAAADLRPLGRAAHRRVDRQGGQGHLPVADEPLGDAGRLRRRPHLPAPAPRRRRPTRRPTRRSTRCARPATR